MKIFANHAHVFPAAVRPAGSIDRLMQVLDTSQIDNAVCFAPFAYQLDGTDFHPNRWLAKELASRPRLRGFGTIDLRRTDIAEEVKAVVEFGFRGLKVHPQAQEFALLSTEAFKLYEAA